MLILPVGNRNMTKSEIRGRIREIKASYGAGRLLEMSRGPVSELMEYIGSFGRKGLVMLLYNSLPDEVDTGELIRSLLEEGHKVLLPTVVGDELELHEFSEGTSLHSGFRGIGESDGALFTDYSSIDLAVVPGVAFTRDGCRLGRGRGFYDRFLPLLECPVVGLAFPFQILESLPCEEHDIKINRVIG